MANYELIATAAMGLEALVANEVRSLGYECTVENGRITFKGDENAIARSNLWLRTADRIKLKVGNLRRQVLMNYLKKQKLFLGRISCLKMLNFL